MMKHIGTLPLEAARFWSWKPHENIEITRTLLADWIANYQKPEYYHWVIYHKKDEQAIGYIYLDEVDSKECSASVHFLLGRKYWNLGRLSQNSFLSSSR